MNLPLSIFVLLFCSALFVPFPGDFGRRSFPVGGYLEAGLPSFLVEGYLEAGPPSFLVEGYFEAGPQSFPRRGLPTLGEGTCVFSTVSLQRSCCQHMR